MSDVVREIRKMIQTIWKLLHNTVDTGNSAQVIGQSSLPAPSLAT
jgi:hypothetical protein